MPPRPVAKMESGTRLAASPPKDTLRPVLDQINSMSLKIPSQDPSPTSPCPLTARQPPKKSPDPKAGQRRPQKSNVTQPPPLQGQRPTPVAQKPKVIPGSPVLSEQSSPRQQAKKEDCSKSLASGYRIWADISGTFSTVAKLLEVQPNIEKILLLKKNGVKISVPIRKLSAKDKAYLETISWGSSGSKAKPAKAAPSSINKTSRQSQTSPKSRTNFDWVEFFLNTGVSRGSSEKYASKIKRCLPAEFDASKLSYRVLKNVLEANDSDILRILNILEADNSTPEDPGSVTSGASPKLKQQPTASEPLLSASPPALHKTLKSETAPHPFASHSPKHAGLQSSSAEGGSIPSEMPDPDALARRNEMINDLKKKRIDTEEALRLAQKTLSQAQDEVLKASLIREESKKVRAEVALNRARETAKQALVMSIQAKENYLKSVRDASSQRQQMQVPHSGTTGTGLASQIPLISSTPQISQLPSTSQLNFRVSQFPSVIPQIPQVPQIPQIPQASHIPQTIHQLPFQHQTPQNFLTSHHLPVPEITPVPTLSSPSNFPPLSAIQPSNVLIPTHINQPLPQPHYSYGQPSQFGQQHRNIISAGPDPLYQTHSTGSGMTIGQIPMNMGQPGSYSAQGAPTAFSDINPSLATTPGKYQNPNASGSYLLNHPHSYPYPPAQDRYTSQPNPYSASAVGTLSNGNHSNVASVTTLQSYHTTTNTSFAGHGPMLGRHDYPNVGPILQPGPNANPTAGQPHPNYTH